MIRRLSSPAALALLVLAAFAAGARAEPPATQPAAKADDILYEDADALSSATVTQVLPNSATSQMTLENVRRIRVKQEIIIIEWGATATTLLPRQYVSSMTINKRNAAATRPGK